MVNRTNFTAASVIMLALLCVFTLNAPAQQPSVSKVPVTISAFVPTTACFNEMSVHAFEVGKEVTSLGGVLSFCTNFKILNDGGRARIILVLDNSGSMCQEVTSCAGASNNDPTNKRIMGANVFVDSMAGMCPDCQIGVINYAGVGNDSLGSGTITQSMTPVTLNDGANITALHSIINNGRCGGGLSKVGKLAKRTLTFTGVALDSAIKMVDAGFDTLPNNRHVILLTDGDWQKPTTSDLLAAYAAAYPGRKMPTIHGVFISDSAGHIAAGFPAYGLVTCTQTEKIPVDMSYLQLAATATGGLFFPGATPQTIVSVFVSLMSTIVKVDTSFCGLSSFTFTDKNTGEQRASIFEIDTAYPLGGHYKVRVPPFDLACGLNTFIMTRIGPDSNSVRVTINDTFTIYRKTTTGTTTNPVFKTESGTDTVGLLVACKPASLLPGGFDTVTIATADARDTGVFRPSNIIVRAFVPFPNDGDPRTLALFHLDNSLANSAPGGQPATGSPHFSDTAVFGTALSGAGSFTTALAAPMSGDFTVECWIKTIISGQSEFIIRSPDFTFSLAKGCLTAIIGSVMIKTPTAVDLGVWQHAAVARINGSVNLYINGIPMAAGAGATGSISGPLTIGYFDRGFIDEMRISAFVRTSEIQGTTVLQIPFAENLQWKIGTTTSALPNATIPSSLWQGVHKGQAQFQVTSLVPGPMIVNFLDMLSSSSFIWSVNGEPIAFGSTGSSVRNVVLMKGTSRAPELKVFDARGKLLGKGTKAMLRSKALDFQGIYFVKYQDGRIERRMNLSQYGNSVR